MEDRWRTAALSRWRSLSSAVLLGMTLLLVGCGQEKLAIRSVTFVDLDRGSGFFDRAIRICFDKPVEATYWHQVIFETRDGIRFVGEGRIRPLATARDPRCQDKIIYMYINRDSPPDSRMLIQNHIHPGNIARLTVRLYGEKPAHADVQPMSEKVFTDL